MRRCTWVVSASTLLLWVACGASIDPNMGSGMRKNGGNPGPGGGGPNPGPSGPAGPDKFGITEIYPTAQGGMEWFLSDTNDGMFNAGSATKQSDGVWQTSGTVRMGVGKKGMTTWKNVEMTGYAQITKSSGSGNGGPHLAWYARGGTHSDSVPCEGTSYKGHLYPTGRVGFKKELWHTGGYSDDLDGEDFKNWSGMNKWVGLKVMMWNVDNDAHVQLEEWVDQDNTNHWVRVASVLDSGDGTGKICSSDEGSGFFKPSCKNPTTQQKMEPCDVINWGGWEATFRSDNITWNFKNLSVREIAPPSAPAMSP